MTNGTSDETLISNSPPESAEISVAPKQLQNPYVGPRAFEAEQRRYFYGRDEEIAILEGLVMSSRAALFFAQSGAGKSSLLRAGLIPNLTRQITVGRGPRAHLYQKMQVFPILGVSGGAPFGITKPIANIYMFNALVGLYPPEEKCDDLADLTLVDAMASLIGWPRPTPADPRTEGTAGSSIHLEPQPTGLGGFAHSGFAQNGDSRHLLIFDQFEELFTHYPERWREREDFFRQVNDAMEKFPNLHVLFSMREDFIAELTPYRNLLPQGLRSRFRLELLKRPAALRAVTEPAQQSGRTFAPGVAESLVDNLRRTITGRKSTIQENESDPDLGEYVEPVHLQIVCRQLWEKLPDSQVIIQEQDVEAFGDVDQALMGFYESALSSVFEKESLKGELSERKVRAWFNEQMITPARTRGLVYRGEKDTEGLPNEAVEQLNNAYIIRARVNGPDIWYELAHDRLVGPVWQANLNWQEHYNNPLDRATRAWLAADRDPAKLLDGILLKEAQRYAADNPTDVLPEERELLEDSRRKQEQREELARQARRRRKLTLLAGGITILVLAVLVIIAGAQAYRATISEAEAKAQAERALVSEREAEAQAVRALASESRAEAAAAQAELNAKVAIQNEQLAQQTAQLALSRQLAGQSLANLDNQFDMALLLALEAQNIADTPQAADSLFSAMYHKPFLSGYLHGHTDGITRVKYSPDGSTLASAGNDRSVRLWDTATRQPIGDPLLGHSERVNGIDWSPDGKRLVSVSEDGSLILWDTQTHQIVSMVDNFDWGMLTAVAFSPDGSTIAVNSESNVIYLWDMESESVVAELWLPDYYYVYPSPVLVFSPDGALLASDGGEGDILLWNVSTRELDNFIPGNSLALTTLEVDPDETDLGDLGHYDDILALDFSPDGKRVASGGYDTLIMIHDLVEGGAPQVINPYGSWVWSLAYSADGENLAASYDNHGLELWDVETLISWEGQLTGHAAVVTTVDFSPDGIMLASAGWDSTIILWDMAVAYPLTRELYSDQGYSMTNLALTSDGKTLAAGNTAGEINLWDMESGELTHVLPDREELCESVICDPAVNSLAISPDDHILAIGDKTGNVDLWDIQAQRWIGESIQAHLYQVNVLIFNRDGSLLISASDDHEIRIWDVASQDLVGQPLLGHSGGVTDLALTQDGKLLASSSWDKTVRFWDLETRTPVGDPLKGHGEGVLSLAFSPDERTLATAGNDQTVRLWDMTDSDHPSRTMFGHLAGVLNLAYNHDGTSLASTGSEGTVILWDLDSGQPRVRLKNAFGDSQNNVLFTPDNLNVLSSSDYGIVYVWNLNEADWREQACKIANRSLTITEWRRFIGAQEYQETCP